MLHESKKQKAGRGTVGKTAVVGAKDRETGKVAEHTDRETLQGFVTAHVNDDVEVYTDESRAYHGLPNR